LFCFSKNYSTI